jgi:toxin-antitoxin system PIN domain toxin
LMRALLDVNAVIALFDRNHPFNRAIRLWWGEWRGGWASCPLTENGFARVISQPGYSSPVPMVQALDVLRIGVSQSDHKFWPEDISLTDRTRFDHAHILGPNQITDVYLLALAVKNNGCLVTFDKSIPLRAVRGAEARHVVVPE